MKTFDPPLEALVGRELSRGAAGRQDAGRRVRRPGAADPPDVGGPAAGLRQTGLAERPRLAGAGPARGRARAAPARVRHQAAGLGEAAAGRRRRRGRDGRDARARSLAPPPLEEFAAAIASPATCTRCCATRKTSPGSAAPGSTRSSGRRALALQERLGTGRRGGRAPARGAPRARRRDRPLRGDDRPRGARQSADAAQGAQARGRALPALRHHDRGGLLLRTPDELLPEGADRRARAQRSAALANCSSRSGRLEQEAEVEAGGRVGEGADGDEVDAGFGDRRAPSPG